MKFLAQRWFLLALATVLVVGMTAGKSFSQLPDNKTLRDVVVASVLFLMALPLRASTIWQTIRRPGPTLLANVITFGVLPLLAWGVSWTMAPSLGRGLLVAAATPCTMASAAVWTRRAGGNDAVANMATVVTNLICFLVTPAWFRVMFGYQTESADLQFVPMVWQLGKLIVLPMVVAQLVRLLPGVGDWATRRKLPLSLLSQCGILFMVFVGAVHTRVHVWSQPSLTPSLWQLGWMVVCVLLVHTVMFWFGFQAARLLRMNRADQIAVGFAGSQKTLMVGLKLALDYGASTLPMIAFHVGQLFVDTWIADRLARQASPTESDQP